MAEYIEKERLVKEAEAVVNFRRQHYIDKNRIADAESTVKWLKYYAPTADVAPVVRCKDCRWWNHAGCAIRIVDDTDKPQANDFCSFGERKKQ